MEKQIIRVSFYLGLLSSLIAIGLRFLKMFGILMPNPAAQGRALWYMSFYYGALLFFLIAVATAAYASVHGGKT